MGSQLSASTMDGGFIPSSSMALELTEQGLQVKRFRLWHQPYLHCLFVVRSPKTLGSSPPSMSLLALEVVASPHRFQALAL